MGGYNNTSIPTRRNHHHPTRVTLPKAPANLSTCPTLCDYGLSADGASAAANTEGVLDVAEVAIRLLEECPTSAVRFLQAQFDLAKDK